MKPKKGFLLVIIACLTSILAILFSHVLTTASGYEMGVNGETTIPFPRGYAQQFRHYATVECASMQMLRKMYVNPEAVNAIQSRGEIPDNTILVMETYSARKGEGNRLSPTQIQNVFVRQKSKEWRLENGGNWRSSWYAPSGSLVSNNQNSCIGCHNLVRNRDFTFTLPRLVKFARDDKVEYQSSEFNTSVCR